MPVQLINHKNKEIIFVDYSHCKNESELIQQLEEAAVFIKKQPGKHLTLSDFSNTHGTPGFMKRAKELGEEVFIPKTQKSACIGMNAFKMILLKGYNAISSGVKVIPFDNREKALGYLIEG